MKYSKHHLFHLDFLVQTCREKGAFTAVSKKQSILCPALAPLLHCQLHPTSRLCHVRSHPLPRHPRNEGGDVSEGRCGLASIVWNYTAPGLEKTAGSCEILYNGLNSCWFQPSQKASQEGPDFEAWSISVPKGH